MQPNASIELNVSVLVEKNTEPSLAEMHQEISELRGKQSECINRVLNLCKILQARVISLKENQKIKKWLALDINLVLLENKEYIPVMFSNISPQKLQMDCVRCL